MIQHELFKTPQVRVLKVTSAVIKINWWVLVEKIEISPQGHDLYTSKEGLVLLSITAGVLSLISMCHLNPKIDVGVAILLAQFIWTGIMWPSRLEFIESNCRLPRTHLKCTILVSFNVCIHLWSHQQRSKWHIFPAQKRSPFTLASLFSFLGNPDPLSISGWLFTA